jgi:hypothetical protein
MLIAYAWSLLVELDKHMVEIDFPLLASILDRILPSDRGIGALEVDVPAYARWLAGQVTLARKLERVNWAIRIIDRLAVQRLGRGFVECSNAERDALLGELASMPHFEARNCLEVLVSLTLAGLLCDPKYKGNKKRRGWQLVGWEPDDVQRQ